MANKIKSCVLISGNGSNLNSIINRSRDYNFPIKICLIITDNINAKGILFAKKYFKNLEGFHHSQFAKTWSFFVVSVNKARLFS